MIKAIFIAATFEQASYWARQWGYERSEIRFVASEQRERLLGYRDFEWPVFVCGTEWPSVDVMFELKTRGFEVFDAETLQA